jgi:general secretion pathway protein K
MATIKAGAGVRWRAPGTGAGVGDGELEARDSALGARACFNIAGNDGQSRFARAALPSCGPKGRRQPPRPQPPPLTPRPEGPLRPPAPGPRRGARGSALLAVLWLSAALAAIAFSLSTTVREETDRASTSVDGLRSYYLAVSGIERASLELMWSVQQPSKKFMPIDIKHILYHFPSGDVQVEVIPEAAKLNVNTAPPDMLYRLCLALGIEPERAQEIVAGIEAFRHGAIPGGSGAPGSGAAPSFPGGGPSFPGTVASFHEIEELLLVKGVTPDIYYGTYVPAADTAAGSTPRLVARQGLADCLSVFGASGAAVDANGAAPAVLVAVGVPPPVAAALVAQRQAMPFTMPALAEFLQLNGVSGIPLQVIGHSIITFRATARLRLPNGQLSDLRRTVASQVKYMPPGYDSQIHILRWYDTAWSNAAWSN